MTLASYSSSLPVIGCEGAATSFIPLQAKILEKTEEEGESKLSTTISAASGEEAIPGKILANEVENQGTNGSQCGTNKSNKNKTSDLPRRASKRLAGVELEPAPEMKTNSQTRRLATRQYGAVKTSSNTSKKHLGRPVREPTTNEESGISVVPLASSPVSEKQVGEEEIIPLSEDKAENKPLQVSKRLTGDEESLPISEEQATVEENDADVKPGSPLNLSLTDLWTDPCIEFAIKTLTGAIPVGDENKATDNPASSLDLPFGELWMDPCIEFAVKTLTGAIPVGDDLGIQNFFQQHGSSSDSQGVSGSMLPNVDNFSQTDHISRHFDGVENKQQVPVASNLLHSSSRSFQNSGAASLHIHVEGRSSMGERQ